MGSVVSSVCRAFSTIVSVAKFLTAPTPIGAICNAALLAVQVLKPKGSPYIGIVLNLAGNLSNPGIAVEQAVQSAVQSTATTVASEIDPKLGAAVGLGLDCAGGNEVFPTDGLSIKSGDCVLRMLPNLANNTSRVLILVNESDAACVLSQLASLGHDLQYLHQMKQTLGEGTESFGPNLVTREELQNALQEQIEQAHKDLFLASFDERGVARPFAETGLMVDGPLRTMHSEEDAFRRSVLSAPSLPACTASSLPATSTPWTPNMRGGFTPLPQTTGFTPLPNSLSEQYKQFTSAVLSSAPYSLRSQSTASYGAYSADDALRGMTTTPWQPQTVLSTTPWQKQQQQATSATQAFISRPYLNPPSSVSSLSSFSELTYARPTSQKSFDDFLRSLSAPPPPSFTTVEGHTNTAATVAATRLSSSPSVSPRTALETYVSEYAKAFAERFPRGEPLPFRPLLFDENSAIDNFDEEFNLKHPREAFIVQTQTVTTALAVGGFSLAIGPAIATVNATVSTVASLYTTASTAGLGMALVEATPLVVNAGASAFGSHLTNLAQDAIYDCIRNNVSDKEVGDALANVTAQLLPKLGVIEFKVPQKFVDKAAAVAQREVSKAVAKHAINQLFAEIRNPTKEFLKPTIVFPKAFTEK